MHSPDSFFNSRQDIDEDFIGVFTPQCDDGTAHQVGIHMTAGGTEHAGERFFRSETQIEKPLFHVGFAGNPDDTCAFAGGDMTERQNHAEHIQTGYVINSGCGGQVK